MMHLGIAFSWLLAGAVASGGADVDAFSPAGDDVHGFLENRGQWPDGVRYRTWLIADTAWFGPGGFTLEREVARDPLGRSGVAVRLAFEGAEGVAPRAAERLPGVHHFFILDVGRAPVGGAARRDRQRPAESIISLRSIAARTADGPTSRG